MGLTHQMPSEIACVFRRYSSGEKTLKILLFLLMNKFQPNKLVKQISKTIIIVIIIQLHSSKLVSLGGGTFSKTIVSVKIIVSSIIFAHSVISIQFFTINYNFISISISVSNYWNWCFHLRDIKLI